MNSPSTPKSTPGTGMPGSVPPSRPRTGIAPWLGVFLVAWLVRLAFVAVAPPTIPWSDAAEYEQMGRLLHEQGTYGRGTLRPPGYPTLVAAIYALAGENLRVLRVVESVLGAAAIALLGALGGRLFGRRAGVIAGALGAFHPLLAFMPSTQYSENTSVVLLVAMLAMAFSALARGGWWRWGVVGVLLGAGILTRANAIVFFPGFAIGALALTGPTRKPWLVPMVLVAVTAAACVVPWMARNHAMWGRWYFVSTGGGRQLFYGNNPWTSADTSVPVPATVDPKVEAWVNTFPTTFQRDSVYYALAWKFIGENPRRAAELYLIKLGNIFALYPDTVSRTFISLWSQLAQGVVSAVVFAGVLLGVTQWRRAPAIWPLLLGTLSYSAATAMVFSSIRYRIPVEPCLLLVAGLGWSWVFDRWRSRGTAS